MIPIAKNIIVVDEQGNQYEATYPKRANGLVKNGRARFINENTICLACPPDMETEDKTMSEHKKLTIDYLLEKLEEISLSQTALTDAICEIGKLKSCGPGDVGTEGQAKAISEMIKARELTNQKLLSLYEKMYDDLALQESSLKARAMKAIEKASDDENKLAVLSEALDTIRHFDS